MDAISDANGKKVVEYALSKVGYPYSQAYRDSGDYYDCSSLAYYAWKNAGVNIMYEGANTAAAEGKFCYDNNYLVNYDEMQPGDLIFYSYSNNGRFFNITHVLTGIKTLTHTLLTKTKHKFAFFTNHTLAVV